jgi:hypothetical protein
VQLAFRGARFVGRQRGVVAIERRAIGAHILYRVAHVAIDMRTVCRGIAQGAAGAGERGGPDLSFARCVRSERAVRRKLGKEWSRYALADRQHCVAETTMGGLASYTNLLGCLQSATEARKMFNGRNRNYLIER